MENLRIAYDKLVRKKANSSLLLELPLLEISVLFSFQYYVTNLTILSKTIFNEHLLLYEV